MREGEAVQGVWLPLALADLLAWLTISATRGKYIRSRADILRGWCLPNLAQAVENDETEADRQNEAEELERGLDWLERTFGESK